MFISNVTHFNFRNLRNHPVNLSPTLNLILGQNAIGKTSVLESIYVLANTKSFRAAKSEELVNWGESSCSVFGNCTNIAGEMELGIVLERGKKQLFVNQNKINTVDGYLGRLTTVCFTPDDLSLIRGAPSERRRFLDKHIVDLQPSIFSALSSFNRALQSKSRILKNEQSSAQELEPWNRILAAEGVKIVRARRSLVKKLAPLADSILNKLSNSKEQLTLQTKESYQGLETEEDVFKKLTQLAPREIAAQLNLIGPQRDDLSVIIGENSAASYASQGQTRSIALAITIAMAELLELERGESPVLLLDDVGSDLDEMRITELLAMIVKSKRQSVITGTDIWLRELIPTTANVVSLVA